MTKVALINIRNQIEAIAQESRDAGVWRSWKSVLLVQCCLRPTTGIDPIATSTLLDISSRAFPTRATIHLAILEYTLDLNARKVQSCRIFDHDDPSLCAGLLTQTISVLQNAGGMSNSPIVGQDPA